MTIDIKLNYDKAPDSTEVETALQDIARLYHKGGPARGVLVGDLESLAQEKIGTFSIQHR